jgi:HTH-type transcriptional regulator / antitoxin HipB
MLLIPARQHAASERANRPMKMRRRDRGERLSAPAHHPGRGAGSQDGTPSGAEAYEQASLRFGLAEAVRRREELGLSQRQLAGMTQTGVARFEAGGTTPTIPVLGRLASALGLQLTISLGPDERCSA